MSITLDFYLETILTEGKIVGMIRDDATMDSLSMVHVMLYRDGEESIDETFTNEFGLFEFNNLGSNK